MLNVGTLARLTVSLRATKNSCRGCNVGINVFNIVTPDLKLTQELTRNVKCQIVFIKYTVS